MSAKPGSTDREIEKACDRIRAETGREPRYRDLVAAGIHANYCRCGDTIRGTRNIERPCKRSPQAVGNRPVPCCQTLIAIASHCKHLKAAKGQIPLPRHKSSLRRFNLDPSTRRFNVDPSARASEREQLMFSSSEGFYDSRGGERL